MNNLIKRTATGIVFILLILGSILVNYDLFLILILILTIMCLWEFYSIVKTDKIKPSIFIGIVTGVFLFVSNTLVSFGILNFKFLLINFIFFFLIFFVELYRNNPNPFINIAFTFLGIFYIAIPFSLFNYFHIIPFDSALYNKQVLLGFFYITWIYETSAYVVGITIGKTKLFKAVSPKKSWEGVIGGSILALTGTFIISKIYTGVGLYDWLIIAIIIIVFSTYGDLFESLLKRNMNKKDSGNILPGHGGILDRFDGLLIALPIVFMYLLFITSSYY